MLLIRRFEEKAGEAYSLGKIGGFCHLYIGQEAVAVGQPSRRCGADDYITCSYREHGQALARGMTARAVMAELFGKATGCSQGKGGSMHLFDAALGFLGGHGIVGGHIPLATGMAFAAKYRGTDQVAVCYFGEAAVNNGAFHEALNMARSGSCRRSTSARTTATAWARRWSGRARSTTSRSGPARTTWPNEVVDGQDVLAVHAAMERAVAARPDGQAAHPARGPHLPLHGSLDVGPDPRPLPHQGRGRGAAEARSDRVWSQRLIARRTASTRQRSRRWTRRSSQEVDDAYQFADESPDPEPAELYTDVYAEASVERREVRDPMHRHSPTATR